MDKEYCSCTESTSHSSGWMANGTSPIICQTCNKEMFIEGIHSRVKSSYVISLLERDREYIESEIAEAKERMGMNVIHIKECKKGLENKEKRIEEINQAIEILKGSNQAKEDNVQKA